MPKVTDELPDALTTQQSQNQNKETKVLTETIELPSKGLVYPIGSVLSEGKIEMKYLTAKDEDILTNESYIADNTVLDKLFESIITSPIKYGDLLIVDRNAVMVAARILSYGPQYEIEVETPSGKMQSVLVDLREIKPKEFDETLITPGLNEFHWTTTRGDVITFKFLTIQDEREIKNRLRGWKKINKFGEITSRLRQMIVAVNGHRDAGEIAQFIDSQLLAADSFAFRNYANKIQPDLDFGITVLDEVTSEPFRAEITFRANLFWPNAGV